MKNDDAYANAAYIDGADQYPPRWAKQAQEFRGSLGARAQVGVKYGGSARQVFDFFHPEGVSRGTLVFVHGGYWKSFDSSSWSHLAQGALSRGWAVAMPSYDLCPDVQIGQITRQIGAAVTEIANRTQGALVLAGHSAGGHLVLRMMDPLVLGADVRDRIVRVMHISPVADLQPLLETTMNNDLQLDDQQVEAESVVNMGPPHGVDVTVWVGAQERPAFVDQARLLARVWGTKLVEAEGKHHFDVIDPLADPDSDMVKTLIGA